MVLAVFSTCLVYCTGVRRDCQWMPHAGLVKSRQHAAVVQVTANTACTLRSLSTCRQAHAAWLPGKHSVLELEVAGARYLALIDQALIPPAEGLVGWGGGGAGLSSKRGYTRKFRTVCTLAHIRRHAGVPLAVQEHAAFCNVNKLPGSPHCGPQHAAQSMAQPHNTLKARACTNATAGGSATPCNVVHNATIQCHTTFPTETCPAALRPESG